MSGRLGVTIFAPPAAEPVDLASAKAHLRVAHNQEDAYITTLLVVARAWLEGATGRAFVTQTLVAAYDDFPRAETDIQAMNGPRPITLPRAPVASVTEIKYLDDNEVQQTLDAATYLLDAAGEPARVRMKLGQCWPAICRRPGCVTVKFVAGVATNAVNPLAVHAIKLLTGQLYEQREAEVTGTIVATVKGLQNLISLLKVPFVL